MADFKIRKFRIDKLNSWENLHLYLKLLCPLHTNTTNHLHAATVNLKRKAITTLQSLSNVTDEKTLSGQILVHPTDAVR